MQTVHQRKTRRALRALGYSIGRHLAIVFGGGESLTKAETKKLARKRLTQINELLGLRHHYGVALAIFRAQLVRATPSINAYHANSVTFHEGRQARYTR